jgi:hypothetical protein
LLVKSDGGLKILVRGVTRSQDWKYPTVHSQMKHTYTHQRQCITE